MHQELIEMDFNKQIGAERYEGVKNDKGTTTVSVKGISLPE